LVFADDPPPLDFERDETITGPPADLTERRIPDHTDDVPPVIVPVRQDPRYPLSQPPYPPSDVRAGNAGTAQIEVYVLPNGRVGDARVVKSTGFDSLDRSALEEAKRKWRLTPATRDGVPIAQWHRLQVTFKVTEQQR
jgi:protein TonB